MTIILLCNQFPPARDGVGDYTFQLAQAFAAEGIRVHVIFNSPSNLTPLPAIRLHQITGPWGKKSTAQIVQLAEQIRPDWIGLQYVPYGFHPLGLPFFLPKMLTALRQTGSRVWITFHEVQVRRQGLKGNLFGILQGKIAKALCQNADCCFTSIEFYKNLLSAYRREVQVLPVGSNIPIAAFPEEERLRMRQQFFHDKIIIISTFGRRDVTALQQAVEQLNAAGFEIGLLVCGATNADIVSNNMAHTRYTGYLPAPEIGRFLQCSDLFVLPDSVSAGGEGGSCNKSGSLAAAFAAGLPVIGTSGDMNNALLQHRQNIWLASDGTAGSLFVAIRELLRNAAMQERLRNGSHKLYLKHLNWELIAAKHLHYLKHASPFFKNN